MSNWGFDLTPRVVPEIRTQWRTISTPIPVPESIKLFRKLEKYESASMHGQIPIVWDKAEGCQVHDPWGNTWIDFTSTIFVANAGHGNEKIRDAIARCLQKPLLHSYSYATTERVAYLEALIEASPEGLEKAFLLSAGTEATECALKLMRLNGQRQSKRRLGVICFEGNWHGRTLGAQMMSFNPQQKQWIGYQDPNIFHLPFPYPWKNIENYSDYFDETFDQLCRSEGLDPAQDICGFMLETFQGWAAAFYPVDFVRAIRKKADTIGALLAFDEMQAGFGRTGTLFGYEHYGVTADLLCCGKGISSSLPLSAVLGKRELMDLPEVGSMSSTHSANPMTCAACHANLQYILDNNLVQRSRELGTILHNRLKKIQDELPQVISNVLGKGLLAGVHFNTPDRHPLAPLASRICEKAIQKGLILVHTGRESIKIGPPLTIPVDALEEGLDVFAEATHEAVHEGGYL